MRKFWVAVLYGWFQFSRRRSEFDAEERHDQVTWIVAALFMLWPIFLATLYVAIGPTREPVSFNFPFSKPLWLVISIALAFTLYALVSKSITALGGEVRIEREYEALTDGQLDHLKILAKVFNFPIVGFFVAAFVMLVRFSLE